MGLSIADFKNLKTVFLAEYRRSADGDICSRLHEALSRKAEVVMLIGVGYWCLESFFVAWSFPYASSDLATILLLANI